MVALAVKELIHLSAIFNLVLTKGCKIRTYCGCNEPQINLPIFCSDYRQISRGVQLRYLQPARPWHHLTLYHPLSHANLHSDCAKSIKMAIHLWTISVRVTLLVKLWVYEHQAQENRTYAGEHLTEASLSAHHIFSKQPFSTKRPPKAISLSSSLNIAEDKTEHAAMAE